MSSMHTHGLPNSKETQMHYRFRNTALLLSAVLALTSVPLVASAQTRIIKVHSYDLDLSSPAGQAELQRRINQAVDQACGSAAGARMDVIMARNACSKTAQVDAVAQYDAVVAARQEKVAAAQRGNEAVR
jgi:UrcA family protein